MTINLMSLCRVKIRKYLTHRGRINLFVRVPKLGLPSLLTEFLLYDLSLDDSDDNEPNTTINRTITTITTCTAWASMMTTITLIIDADDTDDGW